MELFQVSPALFVENLEYTFGERLNPVLKARSEALVNAAVQAHEQTGQPQRQFTAFWYQAGSWPQPRWTVTKVEAHAQGTNRRAVVTNRRSAMVLPAAAYDAFADRGESENRNQEPKGGLQADRLSDHRYRANFFRFSLHTAACNLLVRLRHAAAVPPPTSPAGDLPVEAWTGRAHKAYQNLRRETDLWEKANPAPGSPDRLRSPPR